MQAPVSTMSGAVELTPDATALVDTEVAAVLEETQDEGEGLLLAAAVPKEDAT